MPPTPSGATISYFPSSTRPNSGSTSDSPDAPAPPRAPPPCESPPVPCSTVGTESADERPPDADVRSPQFVQNCAPSRTGMWQLGQVIRSTEGRVQSDELK